jgi:hypothetical protein
MNNIKNALGLIKYYTDEKIKSLLYINLLHWTIFRETELKYQYSKDEKREALSLIIDSLEEDLVQDTNILNLCEFVPVNHLIGIMTVLSEVLIDYRALLNTCLFLKF